MTSGQSLRVLHVSSNYPPFLGGAERVAQSLAETQRAQGMDAQVLTSLDRAARAANAPDPGFVRRLRSWEVAHTSVIPGLLPELLRQPPQSIVHLHVTQAFVPEMVYAARIIRRLRYIAHVHLDVGPSGWAGFMLRMYKPLILRRVLRRADKVIVFTEEQRSLMTSVYGIVPHRIAVIPNGVDDKLFCFDRREMHSPPRLLFVGRLSVQKNLPLLLGALSGISERFETVIVGDGESAESLRRAVDAMSLQNVCFYGRAEGEELQDLYRNADVFVLPSEREGMPLVLLEALAMGLPIVATDIPGSRDLVVHGTNGFLVPLGDTTGFRNALLKITEDPESYSEMSKASRKLVGRYSWRTVSAQFTRIYEELADGLRHGGRQGWRR